jgi:hypothetical protein
MTSVGAGTTSGADDTDDGAAFAACRTWMNASKIANGKIS